MKIFKISIFILLIAIFNNYNVSARSLRIKRSPDFWDSIKGIFGASNPTVEGTTTQNPCQGYSDDGICLGDVDEELVEYKCMFCSKKCKEGAVLDRYNICRKIIEHFNSKKSNKM